MYSENTSSNNIYKNLEIKTKEPNKHTKIKIYNY